MRSTWGGPRGLSLFFSDEAEISALSTDPLQGLRAEVLNAPVPQLLSMIVV